MARNRKQTWHVVYIIEGGQRMTSIHTYDTESEAREDANNISRTCGFPAWVEQV